MEEKDFEAKLRSVNEVKFPLVKAAFKGKDGNVYIGMMLIDTGSVDCILNKSVLSLIDSSLIREDDKRSSTLYSQMRIHVKVSISPSRWVMKYSLIFSMSMRR